MVTEAVQTDEGYCVGPHNIGLRVKAERKAKRWSQTDLSKASGVSRRQISDLENGRANMGIYTLNYILSSLDLTICITSQWSTNDST